ncbi:MAE_28990/MAE_18760 family HEPN-like nuclease [Fusobacterium necrophorum]|uniref:MAE_28990/MAE_18760 family HEPN-like nuclease n=1 Tax=Fusobacterium necrophorum TaxID=859 RepID=UPI00254E1695|nr:MAE_28990/MAE_18760 family HEPN-like nuclease [Fusobacterium necrophorum]MDK4523072.1 MAE_28990/MAE_18760 family HEPN-like nuclease [Fusobacterium necrophorum]
MNLEIYTNRKKEVEYFLKILEIYENKMLENDRSFLELHNNLDVTFVDYLKILKSSCVLILYNFIESTINSLIKYIYEEFNKENITFERTCIQIRKLYLERLARDCFNKTANHNTYLKLIQNISKEIIEKKVLKLDEKIFTVSGNIDGEYINELSKKLGLNFNTKSKAIFKDNSFYIGKIKDDRNILAHGEESFIIKGQNYSTNDLKMYFLEICNIFDDLQKAFEEYINNKKYLNH